jgi:hypothetical protein
MTGTEKGGLYLAFVVIACVLVPMIVRAWRKPD